MATTNGSTAIRDKILASLARYRALRIGKFPCAFWRLSARPGLTAIDFCQKNHHYLSVIYMRQKYSKKSNVLYKNTKSVVPTGYFLKFQPIDL
ncbi:hypothetical protein [Bathymodiolus japonicus methanotrophic gill symbiont]|uniref:hypothetical protein n=1 Tax=Bathymodiolus japonicus methanotrophic gill symbiont TaxID=113269 RepID=UPI001C8F0373|nr:hypothetical protein [Bathymodiolus japonicus methanotrophic gill symbiont]